MIKLLVLQSMYGLSDPQLERQANDKISFLRFLGFPEKVPDQTTVWYFRERLSKTKKDKAIWKELQRQLEAKGLKKTQHFRFFFLIVYIEMLILYFEIKRLCCTSG